MDEVHAREGRLVGAGSVVYDAHRVGIYRLQPPPAEAAGPRLVRRKVKVLQLDGRLLDGLVSRWNKQWEEHDDRLRATGPARKWMPSTRGE